MTNKNRTLGELFFTFTEEQKNAVYAILGLVVQDLQPKTRWIPVSERLPEKHTPVIGTTEFDDIYKTEIYNDCGENKWYADGYYDVPIVAWIPLPEPYKESEDK